MHRVAFNSRKHSAAEANYEIYDNELMAIVRAFEGCQVGQESVKSSIQVLLDHKNLEYIMSNKNLSKRQVWWAEYLFSYNFYITYQPGKKNMKPDTLKRRYGDLPSQGDERYQNVSTVIKPYNIIHLLTDSLAGQERKPLEILLKEGIAADIWSTKVLQMLKEKT